MQLLKVEVLTEDMDYFKSFDVALHDNLVKKPVLCKINLPASNTLRTN